MIKLLSGTIVHKESSFVVLSAGGVGYHVAIAADTSAALRVSLKPVTLWTHLAVRENAMDLYGFLSHADLDFFEKMISISGIGPKKALGLFSAAGTQTLYRAVAAGDAAMLQKIAGVGKKNAEKIVVELRDKIKMQEGEGVRFAEEVEAIEGLRALGYSLHEAKEALKHIPETARSATERITAALKNLSK